MLILSLMTAAVPTKAQAASLEYRGDTVYISGNFTTDDLVKIDELRLQQFHPDLRTASLDSVGGNLAVSILMAGAIAIRKLQTTVEKGHSCKSGCFYLLLAGREPSVDRNARIGVHTARLVPGEKEWIDWKEAGLKVDPSSPEGIAALMKEHVNPDIDTEFLVRLIKKADGSKGKIYWISPSELRKLGIEVRGKKSK